MKTTIESRAVFNEKKTKPKCEKSSFSLREELGISIGTAPLTFEQKYLPIPKLMSGKTLIKVDSEKGDIIDKQFPIHEKVDLDKWICVYHVDDFSSAETLLDKLQFCSKKLGITVKEPMWVEVTSSNPKDWIKAVNKCDPQTYKIVFFIIPFRQEHMYKDLKISSLSLDGFVSQVVRSATLQDQKKCVAALTKVIYQANTKMGGVSLTVDFTSGIKVTI